MFDEQENRERKLANELVALEQQLRGLSPQTPRIDRDRLMFAAGQASVARPEWPGYIAGPSWAGRWLWPAATALTTAATLLLATMLVWQNQPQMAAVETAKPHATTIVVGAAADGSRDADRFADRRAWSMIPTASSGYLGIRYIALTRGVGDLAIEFPSSSDDRSLRTDESRTKPATERKLLDDLIRPYGRSI